MNPPRILIADDTPQILKLFKRILSKEGYSVTAVDSGAEALQVLDDEPVDLLILDLEMPPPDGFELLRILRQQRPGLRILAISGYMQGAMLKPSEFLGATATLNKTDAANSLVPTVQRLLNSEIPTRASQRLRDLASGNG